MCVCWPLQVNFLSLEEHADSDPCKFVLLCRGSSERLTLQAANVDIKKEWVQSIQKLLDMQINFLTGERILKGFREWNLVSWYLLVYEQKTNRSQCCLFPFSFIFDNLFITCCSSFSDQLFRTHRNTTRKRVGDLWPGSCPIAAVPHPLTPPPPSNPTPPPMEAPPTSPISMQRWAWFKKYYTNLHVNE